MQEEVKVTKIEDNKEKVLSEKEEVKIEAKEKKTKNKKEKKIKEKKVKEKKPKKKMSKLELIFDIVSVCFLLGFTIFYGYRLVYYERLFTPKTSSGKTMVLLTNQLKSKVVTTGDGIYTEGRNYVFKGKEVNNYLLYSNMLWRITKINADGTIEIVLDDTLNYLAFDKEIINFEESNLNKYLNDKFYKNLNPSVLSKGTYCNDVITDLNNITCNKKSSSDVKLLSVSDYLNSKKDDNSYLNSEDVIWLYNNDGEKVWLMNDSSLSLSEPNELYQVKPVVVLGNITGVYEGDGTLENPYVIEEKTTYFASYIKLGDDTYRVYDVNDDTLKLSMNGLYRNGDTKYQFSNESNVFNLEEGLGKFLNTTFLEEIPYSDVLVECDFDNGVYNRYYSNISAETIKAKVAVNSLIDPIFVKEDLNYYLSTPYEEDYTYIYNDDVYAVKPNLVRNIKPTVCINKNSITSGKGTVEEPYIVEIPKKENVELENSSEVE